MTENIRFDVQTDYSGSSELVAFEQDLATIEKRMDEILRKGAATSRAARSLRQLARAVKGINDEERASVALARQKVGLEVEQERLKQAQVKTEQSLLNLARLRNRTEKANTAELARQTAAYQAQVAAARAVDDARANVARANISAVADRSNQFGPTPAEIESARALTRATSAISATAIRARERFDEVGASLARVTSETRQTNRVMDRVRASATRVADATERVRTRMVRINRRTRVAVTRFNRLRTSIADSARSMGVLRDNTDRSNRRMRLFNGTVARSIISVTALAALFGTINAIATQVSFADQLVRAEPQIAGLIASTGRLVDAQGELIRPVEAYPLLLGRAREQINLLRGDALRTASTFGELLDNLQSAVGPGLSAGLNLDEIRELTVTISQAATAIGLEQNQLAEEIRSLFTGNINPRNSRIATILGITPEDVRAARQTGDLASFLEESLAGIAEASNDLQGTLTVAFSNVADALLQTGERGIEPFRRQLLELASFFQSEEGLAQFDAIMTGLGTVLADATAGVVSFFESLTEEDISAATEAATALASALIQLSSIAVELGAQALPLVTSAIEGLAGIGRFASDVIERFIFDVTDLAQRIGLVDKETEAAADGIKSVADEAQAARTAFRELVQSQLLAAKQAVFSAPLASAEAFNAELAKVSERLDGVVAQLRTTQDTTGLGGGGLSDVVGADLGLPDLTEAEQEVEALNEVYASLFEEQAAINIDTSSSDAFQDSLYESLAVEAQIIEAEGRLIDAERQRDALVKSRTESERQSLAVLSAQATQGYIPILESLRAQVALAERTGQLAGSGIEGEAVTAILATEAAQREVVELQQTRNAREAAGLELIERVAGANEVVRNAVRAVVDASLAEVDLKVRLLNLTEANAAAARVRAANEAATLRILQAQQRAVSQQTDVAVSVLSNQAVAADDGTLAGLRRQSEIREEISQVQLESARRNLELVRGTDAETSAANRLLQARLNVAEVRARELQTLRDIRAAESTSFGAERGFENERRGDGEIAQQVVQQSVGALRSGLSSAVASALDPNSNTSLADSLAQIGLGIVNAFIQGFLEQAVIQPLVEAGTNAFGLDSGEDPLDVEGGILGTAAGALDTSSIGLTTAGVSLSTAAASLLAAASALLSAALSSQVAGGATSTLLGGTFGSAGTALGNPVPLAGGGVVPGANLRRAPAGAPASDKTLIAGTPGEFMIRKSSASVLGQDFLNAINIDPTIIDPLLGRNRKIPGYAGGGSIGGAQATRNVIGRTSSNGAGSAPSASVVMVVDKASQRTLTRGEGFSRGVAKANRAVQVLRG